MPIAKSYTILIGILILSFLSLLTALGIGYWDIEKNKQQEPSIKLQAFLDESFDNVLSKIKGIHPNEIDFSSLHDSPYDIYIQKSDSAFYWNNYLTRLDAVYSSSSNYLVKYKNIQGSFSTMIGLDLNKSGKLSAFLKNEYNASIHKQDIGSNPLVLSGFRGEEYKLWVKSEQPFSLLMTFSFLFYLLFIAFALIALYRLMLLQKHLKLWQAIFISIAAWIIHFYFISPFYHNTFLAIYTNESSTLNSSLASALVNLLFITLWINFIKPSNVMDRMNPWISNILSAFLITLSFIYICFLAKGFLYSEPIHSLYGDILQYKILGFIFIALFIVILILLFYFSLLLFKTSTILTSSINQYFCWGIGIILTYPISLYLDIQIPLWTLYTFVVSYLLILELFIESKDRQITYVFWWIIILSGFLASITFFYRLNDNIRSQSDIVRELYSAPQTEYSDIAKSIDSILQASDVFPQLSALAYPSRLDKADFESYITDLLDKNGINLSENILSLEATDRQGITLFNNHFSTSYTYTQAISTSNRISEYIFYNPFDNAHYLNYQVENESYNSSPFKLVVKLEFSSKSESENYDDINYVIFKNNNVIKNNLKSNSDISSKQLLAISESKVENDVSYSVYRPGKEVKIVAYSKIGGLIKPISLFSFIVSLSGIFLFFLTLINTRFKILPIELDLKFYDTSSLRTRIQLTIIMLIVFSFLIIGVVTAFYFKNVLEDNNFNTQREEVRSIYNDILTSIDGINSNVLASSTVQSRIDELAHVHDKILVFFDSEGAVQKASFTHPKIARVPFPILRGFTNPSTLSINPRIGLDQNRYTIDFIPVYNNSKNPYGYLGISYKPINNSGRSIRDFLSTILNVYIFLFLIAGALAIAIGNSITKPLSILSKKLKDFKLGKSNQSLEWHTKDEIGKLINEYNMLTKKLDESASILARTERDMAWREMAKQVAHEIKNPLTPMKLSIQYLEKTVKSDPENAKELIQRVSATLIEQINNLNQIADEFSNFAKMPKASNEKIIINEIVEAIHDLFRKREDMDIQMSEPIDDLFVFADRNHLVRILNNIVKNAIQAIPTDRKGMIQISLSKKDDHAIVTVEDNGSGIPDDMKEKVFTPNFTTKNSGTGLGLAISANMIDSFNGKIYFETAVDVGTKFFVEVPLMRLQDNFPDQTRVMLE